MTHDYKKVLECIDDPNYSKASLLVAWEPEIRAALQLAQEAEQLRKERDELAAQLPEGMKHCTIVFEECPVGHGHLRGTNWVKHDYCPICIINSIGELVKKVSNENGNA